MKAIYKFATGSTALLMTSAVLAQAVPLGRPLGNGLGSVLGGVLGLQLGTPLPIVGGGLLVVAAASLGLGIWIVRRKKNR